jgi:serine/threonine protein kinase
MADFPVIPGYKIISKLGEGGMATVYLGIQEKLDRKVAIKILEPSLLKDEETRLRFAREAKTAASLSNFNIIQVFDIGKKGNYYYVIMEYLQDSLRDRMRLDPEGKVNPGIALRIIEALMGALDYVHSLGVLHRDIKPENIMFRQDDTPVLVDFGISRAVDKNYGKDLTSDNIVPGSPHYMSPEQCKAQKMDWRSDIYSLGVVLYELLTGKRPFEDETSIAIVLDHIQSPIPSLPEELSLYQPLIDKMMAKNRSERLRSGVEFKQLVEKISNPSPIPTGVIPLDSTRGEPTSQIRLYFNKYMNVMKENLTTFLNNTTDKLDPIMNKPIMKKLFLMVLPGVIVLILIFIILFRPGYEKTIQKSTVETSPPYNLFIVNDLFKEVSQYQLAYGLYKKDDLESLNEAIETIKKFKLTIFTSEVKALEEKVTRRIKELEAEFKKHFTSAWELYKNKEYLKARESLLQAKEIKTTEDLIFLEKRIEEEAQKSGWKKKKKGITLIDD